jgi:hypothetical protein
MKYRIIFDYIRGWRVYTTTGLEVDSHIRNHIINRVYCRLNGISAEQSSEYSILVILRNEKEYIVDAYETIDDAICSAVSFILENQHMRSIFDFSLLNTEGVQKGNRLEWEWKKDDYYVCISAQY